MRDFRYALIRYIPDPLRMEPINIGILLQGQGRIDFRLNTQASRKGAIDTATFKRWRNFLEEEVGGPPVPLFQPDKSKPQFFTYLQSLCEKTVSLSNPFVVSRDSEDFDELLNSLYQRMVAPPEAEAAESNDRPTGVFREIAEERKFLQRGMKRHAHVMVGDKALWMAYRQVMNGELIAFDKIEVATRIGATANEIERIPTVAHRLPQFINKRVNGKPTRYVLLADELERPFSPQSPEDFQAMKADLAKAIELVSSKGGQVISSKHEAQRFCDELDQKLPASSSLA